MKKSDIIISGDAEYYLLKTIKLSAVEIGLLKNKLAGKPELHFTPKIS